jgi:hypothetical protein
LIGIKDRFYRSAILLGENQKEVVMPFESMLVAAAVVTMFVIFAGVLAWGERQTRALHDQSASGQQKRRSF